MHKAPHNEADCAALFFSCTMQPNSGGQAVYLCFNSEAWGSWTYPINVQVENLISGCLYTYTSRFSA